MVGLLLPLLLLGLLLAFLLDVLLGVLLALLLGLLPAVLPEEFLGLQRHQGVAGDQEIDRTFTDCPCRWIGNQVLLVREFNVV